MRCLISGGTGFIGSYLAKELIDQGEDVILFDYLPNLDNIRDIIEKVALVRGNVLDTNELIETVKKYEVTHIVHLAYLLIPECQKHPLRATKINCEGTNNIFEVSRLFDIERVVWTSSCTVYGSEDDYGGKYVNEDDPIKPLTVYGACKAFNEYMGKFYYELYGLDMVGLRFTVVYGPGRRSGATAFASKLIENPARGEPVVVDYGDQEIDWQYVKDAVKAIVLALKAERLRHRVFNTGGYLRKVREVAEYIKTLLPKSEIKVKPGKLGWHMRFDVTRIKKELGYTPSYTVERGIREHINLIRMKMGLSFI